MALHGRLIRIYCRRYSSWALTSGITKQISDRFDYLVVGKVFTAADLGIFQRGKNIAHMPIEFTASVFNNPLFAAFSRLQDSKEKFLKNYIKIYRIITFLVLPVMVLSFIMADEIIFIFLANNGWNRLCFTIFFRLGFIYILSVINSGCFQLWDIQNMALITLVRYGI